MVAAPAQTELKVGPKGVLPANFTGGKVKADMTDETEIASIANIVAQVDLFILEDKIAEAAVLLFDINKNNRKLWFPLKVALLSFCSGHREIFLAATLIEVAERDFLSQSFGLVPGLFAIASNND